MELKLYVDTFNRKLVKSATSDFPVTLPALFREDTVRMVITLLEPTGNFTAPMQIVDVSDIDIAVGIGVADSDPEVLQETWTKDTTANTFTADVVFNTTELNNAFSNASGSTVSRHLEIEVERSTKFHTVLQQACTLHKDIITNPTVAPEDVTSGSDFANSFAATAADSTTLEWTKTGDYNYAHLKGTTGLSSLTAGKIVKVNSGGTGFELADESSAASAINDLSDVDTATSAPSSGDRLSWNGSNWVPTSTVQTHAHGIDDLSDVDTTTSAPTAGQVLVWDATGSTWQPGTNTAPNLWATVTGDSGTTTADSTTDSLHVAGGAGITTSVSGDTVTVAGEDASETNKGIAKFAAADFTVTSGEVALDAVSLAKGGTGQTTAEDAFAALAPTTSAGDLITHDGSDNVRLSIGTAGQVLKVNSGATGLEWGTDNTGSGGSGSPAGSNYEIQLYEDGAFGTATTLNSSTLKYNGNHIECKGIEYEVLSPADTNALALNFSQEQLVDFSAKTTGVLTFSTNNLEAGRTLCVLLRAASSGAGIRMTIPTDWRFVGTEPTTCAAGKTAILTLTAFGTSDSDVVAAYAEES